MAWQTIKEAARRLGCNPGHLRKVCHDKWGPAGIARLVRNGRTRSRWEIPDDAELDARRGDRAAAGAVDPVIEVRVDRTTVRVAGVCEVTVNSPHPVTVIIPRPANGPRGMIERRSQAV